MSSSRLVSGIKVPAQRTVERGDDLIPGDALCPLFLALLLPSRCAYIRSCKLNIAPISSRMMNRLKENKATIIAFLLSFFSFLHTNLAPQNFPKIPSFRSIFLLPSWRKVKRRRPLSLSLPFLEKGLKEWKRGGCGQNLFRSKGEGSWNFRGFLLLLLREKEKGRERGNWRLPTTTTAAASSRGWEHPGQRWMGLYRKPGFFFLLRDPPANGSHLSDRVDLGSGAWKIQGEEISNFWSFHLISRSLNFEKNFKLSSSPTPPLRSFQKRYIFIYIFSKKKNKEIFTIRSSTYPSFGWKNRNWSNLFSRSNGRQLFPKLRRIGGKINRRIPPPRTRSLEESQNSLSLLSFPRSRNESPSHLLVNKILLHPNLGISSLLYPPAQWPGTRWETRGKRRR